MSSLNLLIGQAAIELGVSQSTLRRLCDGGVIEVPRVGKLRVFPADRLPEYKRAIADHAGAPQPATAR